MSYRYVNAMSKPYAYDRTKTEQEYALINTAEMAIASKKPMLVKSRETPELRAKAEARGVWPIAGKARGENCCEGADSSWMTLQNI